MRPRHAVCLLLCTAVFGSIARPADAAPAEPDPTEVRERLVSIEISVDGKGGTIRTEPEFIDGVGGDYRFGSACGRPVAEPVLQQLFAALHEHKLLRVLADGSGDGRCVARLLFYAR